jgi:hypothetical protein
MRKRIEKSFKDVDFSKVRIHQGEDEDKMLEALGARAFTQGSHVYIQSGGLKVEDLAHEACHIVQQNIEKNGTSLSGKNVMTRR